MLLSVANRPIDSNTTYTTGGEVSRFQRRSVPAQSRSSDAGQGEALAKYAAAIAGRGAPGAAPAAPVGPVVRIARGNNITVVPVGAR